MSNIKNNLKFHYRTKKSVALILTAIILVGSFSFNITNAQQAQGTCSAPSIAANSQGPLPPTCTDAQGNRYIYNGNVWIKNGDNNIKTEYSTSWMRASTGLGIPDTIIGLAAKYDADLKAYNISSGNQNRNVEKFSLAAAIGKAVGETITETLSSAFFTPLILALDGIKAIFAFVVSASGWLFDMSVNMSILQIKVFFDGGVVNDLWLMIRDLINITFIFILLYEAIVMIIGSWGVKSKTTIMNIIISAIFINFSLFITKILIDAGNMVAIELYKQIAGANLLGFSVSGMLLASTGILDLVRDAGSVKNSLTVVLSDLLQITTMGIIIWAYFNFAMIIFGRAVMLVFLAITSPIGFIGNTVPYLGDFSKDWWDSLIDQILVAPFIMFILYFVAKLLQTGTINNVLSAVKSSGFADSNTMSIAGLSVFILLIMFLLKGLKKAQKMSGEVGAMAVKIGGTALAAGAALATGGAALTTAGVAGAFSKEAGEAAKAAGKTGISAAMSRVAFSGKNIDVGIKKVMDSGVGKFATGNYDKTGIGGLTQGILRDKMMGGVKEATGGVVDLSKLEKTLEQSKKDAIKNIEEKAKAMGPEKIIAQVKQVDQTKVNIKTQAENKLKTQNTEAPKKEDGEKAENEMRVAKKERDEKENKLKEKENELKAKEKALNESAKNLADKIPGTEAGRKAEATHKIVTEEYNRAVTSHKDASVASGKASADFSSAEQKVALFEKSAHEYAEKLRKEEEEIAKQMGLAASEGMEAVVNWKGEAMRDDAGNIIMEQTKSYINTLNDKKEQLEKKISAAEAKRNEYINELAEKGNKLNTLLWKDDRGKLISSLRASKPENFAKDFQKFMKDHNIKIEDETPKPEPPPVPPTPAI